MTFGAAVALFVWRLELFLGVEKLRGDVLFEMTLVSSRQVAPFGNGVQSGAQA